MVDSFECKKWTLFTLCLVAIVFTMCITIVPSVIIDYEVPYTEYDAHYLRIYKNAIISVGVVIIVAQLLGLFGAFMENIWLILIYAVVMIAATLGSIAMGVTVGPAYWGAFVLYLIITLLALLHAKDLYEGQNTYSPRK